MSPSLSRILTRRCIQGQRITSKKFLSVNKPTWNTKMLSGGHGAGNPKMVDRLPSTTQDMPPSLSVSPLISESLPEVPNNGTDWSRSYSGLSTQPFSKEVTDVLLAPVNPLDVEMKPGKMLPISHVLSKVKCFRWHDLSS